MRVWRTIQGWFGIKSENPDDCKEFPQFVMDKDFLAAYYKHNLTESIPQGLSIPKDVEDVIASFLERGYRAGDHMEVFRWKYWFVVEVIATARDKLHVQYKGDEDEKWDQWLAWEDRFRIAPLRTYTDGVLRVRVHDTSIDESTVEAQHNARNLEWQ
eukprot:TRINITY_DN26992_c0_g2_i1.p1 TRINITY_DN26992_c0_g2~~TRINITY_DN26992_c0_g2_i1.p1  ORF type:complete len:157 (-),score=31.18 TRINITY_DN26992_c0_g2_i1:12-482(-)